MTTTPEAKLVEQAPTETSNPESLEATGPIPPALAVAPPPKTKCVIQAFATPYLLQLEIPDADVRPQLNERWAEVLKTLPAAASKGFRADSDAFRVHYEQKIGVGKIYANVWQDAINQGASQKKHFILDITGMNVAATPSGFKVVSEVFFLPEITFNEGLSLDKVPVEVYSLHPDFIGMQVDEHLANVLKKHNRFEVSLDAVKEGWKVNFESAAEIDGKVWAAASGTMKDIDIAPGTTHPHELYEALLGKKAGDEFDVVSEKLPKPYGPNAGKRFTAKIKVSEVLAPVVEADEEKIKRAGFQSLEQAKQVLGKQVRDNMIRAREDSEYNLAMHHLRGHSDMGPVPTPWLRTRAQEEIETLFEQHKNKTEKETLALYGVKTRGDLFAQFAGQITDAIREEATLLAFADKHGKADFSLTVEQNTTQARVLLKGKLEITEVEPLALKAKRAVAEKAAAKAAKNA